MRNSSFSQRMEEGISALAGDPKDQRESTSIRSTRLKSHREHHASVCRLFWRRARCRCPSFTRAPSPTLTYSRAQRVAVQHAHRGLDLEALRRNPSEFCIGTRRPPCARWRRGASASSQCSDCFPSIGFGREGLLRLLRSDVVSEGFVLAVDRLSGRMHDPRIVQCIDEFVRKLRNVIRVRL